jgi:hypothetical protein
VKLIVPAGGGDARQQQRRLGGEPVRLLGPEHARTIADSGWSKADLRRAFWERARVRLGATRPVTVPIADA